jgi:hypothetical protein
MSYSYIDQCGPGDTMNQLLTVLGFAHICGQPYFTHVRPLHPSPSRGGSTGGVAVECTR